MMRQVWKYPLKPTEYQQVSVPAGTNGFKPLSVQVQDGILCLWAAVSDDGSRAQYDVFLVPTGAPGVPDDVMLSSFVGTVQYDWLVFHVFVQAARY